MLSRSRQLCTDPWFSSSEFSSLGTQNRPETVPRLPDIETVPKPSRNRPESSTFQCPAAPAARAHARHIPMAIGVNPVNPQHQNQNHPAAAMGPGVSGAGVSGVRFHQGGAASVRPRRASIALTEHGGADFFRSGRGLPGLSLIHI